MRLLNLSNNYRLRFFHQRNIKWRSICGNDLWHKTQGYIGTLRCGQAFIWNKNRGLEGYLQTNVINYEKEKIF